MVSIRYHTSSDARRINMILDTANDAYLEPEMLPIGISDKLCTRQAIIIGSIQDVEKLSYVWHGILLRTLVG